MSTRAWLLGGLLLAVAGCSQEKDPARTAGPELGEATAASPADRTAPGPNGATPGNAEPQPRTPGNSFARLPDRGDLVGYPDKRVVRREGAYTWHRADFSEAHALAAIANGMLNITAPSGERLQFLYERHVEHPSGDWTWFGRVLGGNAVQEAVLTFGKEAAFGSIHQPGKAPLKLKVEDGVGWLMETDLQAAAAVASRHGIGGEPDYLVPQLEQARTEALRRREALRAAASTEAPVVDLLVAYTWGYQRDLGTASMVQTRIHYLVDVVNEAFANSEIDATIRLAHSMLVDYPDATDNTDALYEMSTERCDWFGCRPDRLRDVKAARDAHGADLVTLLRKAWYGNVSCGVAWVGAWDQNPIADYADWGYSVVSEGAGLFEDGSRYICEDDTLAHELGHNLGSMHDRATVLAGNDGVLEYGAYPYGFGHKTGAGAGDFITIMSYIDSRGVPPFQSPYWVFSNPDIDYCGGMPCGVEDVADNARSINQTAAGVAGYRGARSPVAGVARNRLLEVDVNGDARSDLLFFDHLFGRVRTWFGGEFLDWDKVQSADQDGVLHLVDSGDLDGNGRGDLLYRGYAGELTVGLSDGTGHVLHELPYRFSTWQEPLALADVNGDHRSDILIRDKRSGRLSIWYMAGAERTAFNAVDMDPALRFVDRGEFNRDRFDDLLWVDGDRNVVVSLGVGLGFDTAPIGLRHGEDYDVAGLVDMNGDRRSDILVMHQDSTRFVVWFMSGASRVAFRAQSGPGAGMTLVAKGHFDANRRGDLVWRDATGSSISLQLSQGVSYPDSIGFRDGPEGYSLMDAGLD